MAGTPLLERLTASDLFLLLWDDYGWSTDIGGLAVCGGTSLLDHDRRVRIEEVRARLEPRLHLIAASGNLTRAAAALSYTGQLQPHRNRRPGPLPGP